MICPPFGFTPEPFPFCRVLLQGSGGLRSGDLSSQTNEPHLPKALVISIIAKFSMTISITMAMSINMILIICMRLTLTMNSHMTIICHYRYQYG